MNWIRDPKWFLGQLSPNRTPDPESGNGSNSSIEVSIFVKKENLSQDYERKKKELVVYV